MTNHRADQQKNIFLDPNFVFNESSFGFNCQGKEVEDLQKALMQLGYELPKYGADGHLGAETVKAVQSFDRDHAAPDHISMVVRGSTLEQLRYRYSADVAPDPPVDDSLLPVQGKHMYIRSLSHTGEPNDEFADRCTWAGIKGIWIQRIWQFEDPNKKSNYLNGTLFDTYRPVIEALGLEVWVWGYPVPDKQSEFIDAMTEACEKWNAKGMVVDAEGPWRRASGNKVASLMTGLKSIKRPVALSSFGAPWNFPTFPWEAFAEYSDWGNPQIYDHDDNQPDDYPVRSVEAWGEKGFENIVPASSAYKSYEQMMSLLDRTPVPCNAMTWWDWYNANLRDERWEAIKRYDGV